MDDRKSVVLVVLFSLLIFLTLGAYANADSEAVGAYPLSLIQHQVADAGDVVQMSGVV